MAKVAYYAFGVALAGQCRAQSPMVQACSGQDVGSDCSFSTANGSTRTGTCGPGSDPMGNTFTNGCVTGGTGGTGCATNTPGITCTTQYTGTQQYMTDAKPMAAPLRGSVGCTDADARKLRADGNDYLDIYGPMEAGFSNAQPGMACMGDNVLACGIDTSTAELVIAKFCEIDTISILDYCGGHTQYHYHEKLNCLYTASQNGHSTRVGTAADGNGIYGPNIEGGVLPTDLDGCGGRTGVTPDSNGVEVYYYPIKASAPFTLGCYGPGTTSQCRDLYAGCSTAAEESLTTKHGTDTYQKDCPCYDADGSNVPGRGRPAFLPPSDTTNSPTTDPSKAPSAEGDKNSPTLNPSKAPSAEGDTNSLTLNPSQAPDGGGKRAISAAGDLRATSVGVIATVVAACLVLL